MDTVQPSVIIETNHRIKKNEASKLSGNLLIPSTLRSLQKQDLLLHDGIVLEHTKRTVRTGTDHRAIETGHGHGNETHGDSARLDCMMPSLSVFIHHRNLDLGFPQCYCRCNRALWEIGAEVESWGMC